MKKILIVLIINLLWCNIGYSKDINLKCINEESIDKIRELRVKFNKKIVEVNDGKNLLEFKVNDYNQEQVLTIWRGLEKGNTSYDTHVINWNKWDNRKYKKYLYKILINRLDGEVYHVRSTEPSTSKTLLENFNKYEMELAFGYKCKSQEMKF